MRYRTMCPYCHHTLSSGKGSPFKHIGEPLKRCPMCKKYYIDSNMYEWGAISPLDKFWFCFASNNRGILFFLFLLFSVSCYAGGRYSAAIILAVCSVLHLPLSVLYVKLVHRYAIEESFERCKHEAYIKRLKEIKYDKLYLPKKPIATSSTSSTSVSKKTSIFVCENCGQKLTPLHTKCTFCNSSSIKQYVLEEDISASVAIKFGEEVVEATNNKSNRENIQK